MANMDVVVINKEKQDGKLFSYKGKLFSFVTNHKFGFHLNHSHKYTYYYSVYIPSRFWVASNFCLIFAFRLRDFAFNSRITASGFL